MTNTTTTTTDTRTSTAAAASSVSSSKFGTFVITVAIVGTIMYVICLLWNLPLVTYHPAVNRLDLGLTEPRSGEGPAMYWYGWTLTVIIVSAIAGLIATMLPENVSKRIPLVLVWVLPILAIPFFVYSLKGLLFHP
jgi:hypothetical protein